MIHYKDFLEFIIEERIGNPSWKQVDSWIRSNGFDLHDETGRHPKYKHVKTGFIITGVNKHGKDANPNAVGNIARVIRRHHSENNLAYTKIHDA